MNVRLGIVFFSFLFNAGFCSPVWWKTIRMPTSAEAAAEFQSPPAEYGPTLWWGWDGPVDEEAIRRDLDAIQAFGFTSVMIEAGYNMAAPYLSQDWFNLVGVAVREADRRGMKVWIEDEGKYPSGFAGGKFSAELPDLRMQALVAAERIDVQAGERINRFLLKDVVSAAAFNLSDSTALVLDFQNRELKWTVPEGRWQIFLVQHNFKTSPTRSVNDPTRGKNTQNSLMDYLNPEATKQFLAWTHEGYKRAFGSAFGLSFMGFMGDEPDYSINGIPWTPRLFDVFRREKGYDVRPLLATFFLPRMGEEARRVKADYWDVWSGLFAKHFFKIQSEWCEKNRVAYVVHLNHEDQMPALVRSGGDFFRNMRPVAVPGVDAIWSQIWMDHTADYPQYASSAAHVYGKPRAFSESFAAFTIRPDVSQAKWVMDYQLVRGINWLQVMFYPSSAARPSARTESNPSDPLKQAGTPEAGQIPKSFFTSPDFPPVADYLRRISFLLSQGRPAARIALLIPTTSLWLGDAEADRAGVAFAQKLLENQRDFDWVDEEALGSVFKVRGKELVNQSGQGYGAVIVPPASAISRKALERLMVFSRKGGCVVFLGRAPSLVVDKTFLYASGPPDVSWAHLEASGQLSKMVLDALPEPDVVLDQACPSVKCLHRKLKDADVYFLFNESPNAHRFIVQFAGRGRAQSWNPFDGSVAAMKQAVSENGVRVSLDFMPGETQCIVVGPLP